MTGTVFDIQHFCTGDGPGIRTTVFLKGCTLHCPWCHNSESQSFRPEILMNRMRCIGCGACDAICPAGDAKGTLARASSRKSVCGPCVICAENCPSGCLEVAGRTLRTEEVMREVLQDEAYYRHSGGGVTLSGGEPMAQPAFSRALLEAAKEGGLHTAVETSGDGRIQDFLDAAPLTDLWLWDIKMMDEALYRELTGGSLERMLTNLAAVAGSGATIRFRVLYIPDFHDRKGIAEATAALLKSYPQFEVEVIPYHLLGNAKREKLGLPEIRFREPSIEETALFSQRIGLSPMSAGRGLA